MPINFLRRGGSGRVYLKDERADGAIVVLVCEVADDDVQDALGGTGVVYAPDPPGGGGGSFPMPWNLLPTDGPLELTIDTSGLAAGVSRFRLGVFAKAVAESASNGTAEIHLTPEIAKDFGLIGELAIAGEGELVDA
jgi:hypothetical protein